MSRAVVWVCVAVALACVCSAEAKVQCLGPDGSEVDWYYIFKLPNGFQFGYWDPSSSGKLTISSQTLDAESPVSHTLNQIYDDKTGLAFAAYNDNPPDDEMASVFARKFNRTRHSQILAGSTNGHTKGVVGADGDSGFWLIHSVPELPSFSHDSFEWGESSHTYGQSFLCLSVDASGFKDVTSLIQFNDPKIYDSNLPSDLTSQYQAFGDLIDGTRQDGHHIADLTSLGGTDFTAFGKSGDDENILYEDIVQPELDDDFYWETWRRKPKTPTFCRPQYDYSAMNVETLSLDGVDYKYTQDHSKYGASVSGSWVCVGGINRMDSQVGRGGGTLCQNNPDLWSAVSDLFTSVDDCDSANADADSLF